MKRLSHAEIQDRAVLSFLMQSGLPYLRSDIECSAGTERMAAFDGMVRSGLIEATFPEATAGDSGRQFWRLMLVAPTISTTKHTQGEG